MTDIRQAAQQALEALKQLDGIDTETECVTIDAGDVITALRTALEQPQQEQMRMPKAGDKVICLEDESFGEVVSLTAGGSPDVTFDDGSRGTYMLGEFAELFGYVTPPAAQPVQEPTCPKCKAAVLYECVACSNNNYPPRPEQQAESCVGKDPRCPCQDGDACHYKDCGNTKALPVPQAEPVAWMADTGSVASLNEKEQGYVLKSAFNIPLYTTPPAAQRKWQGLTDEEIDIIYQGAGKHDLLNARAVESKLKERNT